MTETVWKCPTVADVTVKKVGDKIATTTTCIYLQAN